MIDVADQLLALINSSPRTPSKDEINQVLQPAAHALWQMARDNALLSSQPPVCTTHRWERFRVAESKYCTEPRCAACGAQPTAEDVLSSIRGREIPSHATSYNGPCTWTYLGVASGQHKYSPNDGVCLCGARKL